MQTLCLCFLLDDAEHLLLVAGHTCFLLCDSVTRSPTGSCLFRMRSLHGVPFDTLPHTVVILVLCRNVCITCLFPLVSNFFLLYFDE